MRVAVGTVPVGLAAGHADVDPGKLPVVAIDAVNVDPDAVHVDVDRDALPAVSDNTARGSGRKATGLGSGRTACRRR
eukprot:102591-Alexandrium_andersonii.AAC.1